MSFRNRHLIHSLNSGFWHIRKDSAFAYLPSALNFLGLTNSPSAFGDTERKEAQAKEAIQRFVSAYSLDSQPYIESWYYDYPPFLVDNVLVIPIMEVIDQEDYCGVAGTNTITAWYEMAAKDSEILGVVELMNSPGGSVFGTDELATYKLSYPKPIVTQVTGMNCSAAQYISSSSNHIQCSSKNCLVGSVGVMTTFRSFKEYYKKQGIDIREIYSKASPKKNEASRLAAEGNDTGYTDGVLFSMDTTFMDFIKTQRPAVTKDVLDGADMTADKGMLNGLVDSIGTLKEAVQKVQELAQNQTNNTDMSNKTDKKIVGFRTDNPVLLAAAKALNATIIEGDETTPPADDDNASANNNDATPPAGTQDQATPGIAAIIAEQLKPITASLKTIQEDHKALMGKNDRSDAQGQALVGKDGKNDLSAKKDDDEEWTYSYAKANPTISK
ncbi:S49 family peptidase [Arcicella sp. LKC2W]|uniref:S49 family peptidase n=1 Tax=Arcicella sp. LKC2W TaxID=2984198 RepID=UPI002B1FD0C6|nr:S49 family peptidase [Arcicella sp. LKC2W]MEA5459122.1 S49 family peptidase [Arcicella sp. LKC2W]